MISIAWDNFDGITKEVQFTHLGGKECGSWSHRSKIDCISGSFIHSCETKSGSGLGTRLYLVPSWFSTALEGSGSIISCKIWLLLTPRYILQQIKVLQLGERTCYQLFYFSHVDITQLAWDMTET